MASRAGEYIRFRAEMTDLNEPLREHLAAFLLPTRSADSDIHVYTAYERRLAQVDLDEGLYAHEIDQAAIRLDAIRRERVLAYQAIVLARNVTVIPHDKILKLNLPVRTRLPLRRMTDALDIIPNLSEQPSRQSEVLVAELRKDDLRHSVDKLRVAARSLSVALSDNHRPLIASRPKLAMHDEYDEQVNSDILPL